jgi:REP element-mobilizing transposase RayT
MPRKPRLHVPGGLYHVILRGNSRQAIFFDDADRSRWEAQLAEGLCRYGHRVHAYCWMTNHIHMAVQCRVKPVAQLMRFVASGYARSTNRKMGRSGHLFERRHRLVLVSANSYLKQLVRYIHQNPVRAGMVDDLAAYRWSSHSAYVGAGKPDWLTVDWVLSMFAESELIARQRYCAFVQRRSDEVLANLFKAGGASDDRMLGDDEFGKDVAQAASTVPPARTLDKIIASYCAAYGVAEVELVSKSRARRNARIRAEIAREALEVNAATLATIARRFGRCESVVSRGVARLRGC